MESRSVHFLGAGKWIADVLFLLSTDRAQASGRTAPKARKSLGEKNEMCGARGEA